MTYTDFRSEGRLTAFGEYATAEYIPLAAWKFPYTVENTEMIVQETENGGTVSHSGSFAQLSTGTSLNGKSKIYTKAAIHYQPGLGGLVRFTDTFSPGVAGTEQIIGYGDETDGYFFGYIGTEFGALRINNSVRTFTPLSSFSEGTFSGFDTTLLNVYKITFQWLGGGEIKFFIENPNTGKFETVHRIQFANTGTDVSIQNPNLPLSAWVDNGTTNQNIVLRTPSASGGLEGNVNNRSLIVTRGAGSTEIALTTTPTPILSLYNPLTYQTKTNRLALYPTFLSIAVEATNGIAEFRIIQDPTLTGSDFTAIDSLITPAESDTTATAATGGSLITGIRLSANRDFVFNLKEIGINLRPGSILSIEASSTKSMTASCFLTFDSEM